MNQPLMNKRNDLTGNSILRVCRQQLMARFIPMGSFRGGGGARCLIVFMVLHYPGRPLFRLLIRFERQLHRLYRLKERIALRGKRKEELELADKGV